MPFFSDILRPFGVVAAAGLAATGVGIPLALGIGAGLGTVSNLGADAIDRADAASRADDAANNARREAEAELARQEAVARAALAEAERVAQAAREKAARPAKVIKACRENRLRDVPALLQQLDDTQLEQITAGAFAACRNGVMRRQVAALILAEEERRHPQSQSSMRPR